MSMFKPTADEINSASAFPTFKADEVVGFIITNIKETKKKDKEGVEKDVLEVKCKVLTGTNKDKSHTHFYRSSTPSSLGEWVNLLRCFWKDEDITKGINPSDLIGRMFKATAKEREYEGKKYVNFRYYTVINSVPTEDGSTPNITADDIPW